MNNSRLKLTLATLWFDVDVWLHHGIQCPGRFEPGQVRNLDKVFLRAVIAR